MSLINQALQRAEREKLAAGAWGRDGPDVAGTDLGRKQRGLRGSVVLAACVFLAVGAVVYFTLPAGPGGGAARPAAVDPTVEADPDEPAGPRDERCEEAAAALNRTLKALADFAPPTCGVGDAGEPAAAKAEPAPAAAPAVAAIRAPKAVVRPSPPVVTATAPPALPETAGVAVASVETSPPAPAPKPPAARAPTPPAEAKPVPAPAAADTDGLKLEGILRAGRQCHALINGKLVTVGDEIAGARIVGIERYHVVLERDARRFVLRM